MFKETMQFMAKNFTPREFMVEVDKLVVEGNLCEIIFYVHGKETAERVAKIKRFVTEELEATPNHYVEADTWSQVSWRDPMFEYRIVFHNCESRKTLLRLDLISWGIVSSRKVLRFRNPAKAYACLEAGFKNILDSEDAADAKVSTNWDKVMGPEEELSVREYKPEDSDTEDLIPVS